MPDVMQNIFKAETMKLTAEEILKRNIHYLLLQKGLTYADLPVAYTPAMKSREHFNPTLDTLVKIAERLGVSCADLLNPKLEISGMIELPPGFLRLEAVLSEPQAAAVRQWEQINLQRIRAIRQAKLARYQQLTAH